MRIFPLLLSGLLIGLPTLGGAAQHPPQLEIIDGTTADGKATALWLEMLDRRLSDADFAAVAGTRKPYTAEETAWARLIRSRHAEWTAEIPALVALFEGVIPPARVSVVLGNRGTDDAFSHKPQVIGFDLSAIQRVYGDASRPGNAERIDRFFRHEYVHLLQHAWWQKRGYDAATPLQHALAEIWAEGLGNHFSLSQRWRSEEGRPSPAAAEALAALEPRFVARLAALACADAAEGARLTADLSRGRFDRKWGALTAALWIEQEASTSDQAMRNFVAAGPDGIWALAERHVAPALSPVLEEIRAAERLCHGQRTHGQEAQD